MQGLPPVYMGVNAESNNFTATPSTSAVGTLLTAAGSAHTKGSWAPLIDPVPFDVYGIWLQFTDHFTTGSAIKGLTDIGIGPSGGGSEVVVVPNLLTGGIANLTFAGGGAQRWFYLPLFIPEGTRLSARHQSTTASKTIRCVVNLWGGPSGPAWPTITHVDAYGITEASSSGVSHTPGNTGAESAWASVGSTLSKDYDGFFVSVQGNNGTETAIGYHLEFGYSSTTLCEVYCQGATNETICGPLPSGPFFVPLPSGTQMQVRGEASGTAVAKDVAIYCFNTG